MKKGGIVADSNFLLNDQFWKIFECLESLKRPESLEKLSQSLQVEESEFKNVLLILNLLRKNYKYDPESLKVYPDTKDEKIKIEMNSSQLMAFQKVLKDLPKENYSYKMVSEVLEKEKNHFPDLDFEQFQENVEQYFKSIDGLNRSQTESLYILEKALLAKQTTQLSIGRNTIEFYPQKIVYLDEFLTVVGEDVGEGCLVAFRVENIFSSKIIEEIDYRHNYSTYEVDDFISAMRAVSGNEDRLILKILRPDHVDLNPPYHFLGGAYMTSNSMGESIWAASVEPSEELYRWLYTFKDDFKILDPESLKGEFEEFCQKNEKQNYKKAA